MSRPLRTLAAGGVLLLGLLACSLNPIETVDPGNISDGGQTVDRPPNGETARVTRVIDGDTIEVERNGEIVSVRYLGMNTTERGETCYREGTEANRALVEGQTVTLVADEEDRDRYNRLLRYIYVGDTFVNAELVRSGWAEAVVYQPNDRHWSEFVALEREAARANRGCHGLSDMFDDGTFER